MAEIADEAADQRFTLITRRGGAQQKEDIQKLFTRQSRAKRAVPLLLFPKPFEMFSFLSSVEKVSDAWINDDKLDDVKMFSLQYKDDKTGFQFSTYVHSLDSSDIDFSFKLGEFIKNFQTENQNYTLHITLAGTCGGSLKAGRKIGQAFRITKAVKFDRGSILKSGDSFILSIDKPNMSLTCSSTKISWGETILSCNHVVCVDPVDFAEVLKVDKSECTLCDMETFEFFTTCYFMGIVGFDCVRVVSDVFKDGSDRDLEKLTRKHVDMIGILQLLTEKSFEGAVHTLYENYVEPPPARKVNHEFLIKRMKSNIERLRSGLVAAYVSKHPDFEISDHLAAIKADAPPTHG
eukprot:gene38363-50361_t